MTLMHAMRIHEFGGPEILRLETLPVPVPQDDEILVRIAAASVNPVDYKTREGKFPPVTKDNLPITLGRDLAGTVESFGSAVQGAAKGDAVFALLGRDRGAYAQFVTVKPGEFAAQPKNLEPVQAAAVPLAALTAWQGMFVHGGLRSGQRVLIHGGAGGVGHLAIQLAKAKGAFVVTTASKDDLDFVREIGADQAIDYKNQKFEDEVKDIDLVYDLIGGDTQTRSFAVLKNGGALVSTLKEPDKARAKEKNLHTAHYMAEPNAAQLAEIGGLIASGKVKPSIQATFPLEDAGKAQSLLEGSHVRGKVVLTVA
jgi:NADPH:quinone reductase-like Zn-dependent oxidoreductase